LYENQQRTDLILKGIGSDHLIRMDVTLQPAFGGTSMMLESEVLEKLIDVLLVLRGYCILNGALSVFSFSSKTTLRIGRSLSGLTEKTINLRV
jgi:hypothetical protein